MESNNYIEHGNERIPTREEILDVIGRHAGKIYCWAGIV